ncbi:MAG TPA: acetyl-CoA synthetase [Candidatus Methanoperedenaceae archaeon]|nr:acetyl-CoA synthetase [Candidatus Methanoperedenaceae archaeon]
MRRPDDTELFGMLGEYGIPLVPYEFARTRVEAVAAAKRVGYPCAMKISSKDIPHKTDAGGVVLGIASDGDAGKAFDSIMANARNFAKGASLDGVVVQKMPGKGIETIIGIKKDPQFGHVLMFGLGGIFVEVYKDIAFRVAPVSVREALDMVREIKGYRILAGLRRQVPYDIDAVVQVLMAASTLVEERGDIAEMDINPLIVHESGATAVDARALFE